MTLSTALWRPTSSRTTSSSPRASKSAAAWRPPVASKPRLRLAQPLGKRVEELGVEARGVLEGRRRLRARARGVALPHTPQLEPGVEVPAQRLEVDADARAQQARGSRCRRPRDRASRSRGAAPRGRAATPITASLSRKPSASSRSWPGVRITTASGAPPTWISRGSSWATRSSPSLSRSRSRGARSRPAGPPSLRLGRAAPPPYIPSSRRAASDIMLGFQGGSHTRSTSTSRTPATPRTLASTSGGQRSPPPGTSAR